MTLEPGQKVTVTRGFGPPQPAEVLEVRIEDVVCRVDGKRRAVLRDEPMPTFDGAPAPTREQLREAREKGAAEYRARPVKSQPKAKPARSESYRQWVAQQPCCGCGREATKEEPNHPHHAGPKGASGGMGTKADDFYCIPLCSKDHLENWHQGGFVTSTRWLPMSKRRAATEQLFLEASRRLLVEWCGRGRG